VKVTVRAGQVNGFWLSLAAAVGALAVLGVLLWRIGGPAVPRTGLESGASRRDSNGSRPETPATELFMYCAAGLRLPVEQIVADYRRDYGVSVQIQYGGSNTLLSQMGVARTGDLYLAADDVYLRLAREQALVRETVPLAVMRPVIVVRAGNPKRIHGVRDLLRDDVKTSLANPDQAAIGRSTRELLEAAGQWNAVEAHVTRTGVFKPTVPEVANDVKLGSVDAAIVWDATLALYPTLEAVRVPEWESGVSHVEVGVASDSRRPTAALRFARYLSARDRGLLRFREHGFETVEGDKWSERPEIAFFCGSVNRRAVESVVADFQRREGVVVNTVYNGCGILTAQMRTIRDQRAGSGFPDSYMACDRYYLETVKDWFQDGVEISETAVVIAVPKGNPAGIERVQDLTKPGVRVSVGQPDQCTIGVLTRQVLKAEGIYDEVMKNVVTQTASSAMLIPTVTTGSVDATLAYATDTRAESDKVDAIAIASPAATAIQPFAIARSSDYKNLSRRLLRALANSRHAFETAGFHFRLGPAGDDEATATAIE
jgi:molybdate transport system substrate-binding protein